MTTLCIDSEWAAQSGASIVPSLSQNIRFIKPQFGIPVDAQSQFSFFGPLIRAFISTSSIYPLAPTSFSSTSPSAIGIRVVDHINSGIAPGLSSSIRVSRSSLLAGLAALIRSFTISEYLAGDDARLAINRAAADALIFAQIIPIDIDVPRASYSDDGEIVLHWSQKGGRAEIAFAGDGEIGYAMQTDGIFYPGAESATSSKFPLDLLRYLRK